MIDSVLGSAVTPVFNFFDSLILCSISDGKKWSRKIGRNQKKLGLWAHHAPMNYSHKYDLVEAERHGRAGDRVKAEALYKRAITGAHTNGFIQEEALANERAAAYYRSINNHSAVTEHITRACRLYEKWGSAFNSLRVARSHPALTYSVKPGPTSILPSKTRADQPGPSPDYYALIQSLLAISGEINLSNLLSRIMRIILQNSGAQRGVLALTHEGDLHIEAEGRADLDDVTMHGRARADEFKEIPLPILDYVKRTRETVVLDDAVNEGTYAHDPYIRLHGIRSLLCMPILRGIELTGIIYLENALTARAFYSDRFEILKLLTVQAAISLENALLFKKQREAENELIHKYEEIQSQYEEMEAINEQLEETYRELEDANLSLSKKAETLRLSEERYRLLVETMTEGLCMVDYHGIFYFVNDALCRMLGYEDHELLGKPVHDFIDEENKDILTCQLEKRRMGLKEPYELRWKRKDGADIFSIVSPQTLYDSHHNITGSFSVITNITERRKAEINQEKMREQLLQSQKMEAIGTLAGGIAHDFNNQLTAIMGYIQLILADTPSSDPRSVELREVLKAADRSASLTRQLLAFSRRQLLKKSELDLNEIVTDMSGMLRRFIGEDIDLVIDLGKDLRLVNADRGQVEQIIMNLTVNARDAMEQGGRLIIRTENVILNDEACAGIPDSRTGSFVSLSVVDNGAGIKPEIQSSIFEPFFTTKEQGKGTGLGLAVVYGIITQHGGWINVTSEPDQGASFTIFFPALDTGTATIPVEPELRMDRKGHGEVVLIVEDQDEVRTFSRTALERNGYRVFTAATAREAEIIVHRERGGIDILFCDVVLPDENGFILATRIVNATRGVKVLLTSGYTDDKAQWDRISAEGYAFLQKPYSLYKLLSSIAELTAGK